MTRTPYQSEKQRLVSVIIPAFNAAACIAETIQSVQAQNWDRLEMIVVDDGSTDDTAEVVCHLAKRDRRIRLIRQPNQGVAAARNRAIAEAKGEYVAPLDADDLWHPDKLRRQVERLEEAGPDVGLVYCWWDVVDESGRRLARSYPWALEGELADVHVALNFIGNASVPLIRRSCLDELGMYDPSLRAQGGEGCEDWDLSLRISERYEMCVVPEYLVEYRCLPWGMSGSFRNMIQSHELLIQRIRARRMEVPDHLIRWSRGLMYGHLVTIGVRSGHLVGAARCLLRAILRTDVSLRSPWVLELLANKLPPTIFNVLCAGIWRLYAGKRGTRPNRGAQFGCTSRC